MGVGGEGVGGEDDAAQTEVTEAGRPFPLRKRRRPHGVGRRAGLAGEQRAFQGDADDVWDASGTPHGVVAAHELLELVQPVVVQVQGRDAEDPFPCADVIEEFEVEQGELGEVHVGKP
ncbi:hypothetical protein [Streptomyces sp. SID12501]|uniref:Uncharacterized protein n=1 Tax=Streptomyces sp. SID12501 TaxID=2706042 RepID=A0A6B3BVH2_9ACTN|nr:hypothetical protein [Streptomyces sp. SID12501]NEC88391.1 hypothetical protein [Streptomyces sp. SID12501]